MLRRAVVAAGKGFRETGQALERMGMRSQDNWVFQEKLCRHRAVMNLYDQRPDLSQNVFVAPNASVIGNVEVKDCSSIWCASSPRPAPSRRAQRAEAHTPCTPLPPRSVRAREQA